MILSIKTSQITWLVQLLVLVLVLVVQPRLEVLGHRLQQELLLLELRPVRLLHNHRLHNQCWRRMLNRSCCHMMSHS